MKVAYNTRPVEQRLGMADTILIEILWYKAVK